MTNKLLTPEHLAEIKRLAREATPGPWQTQPAWRARSRNEGLEDVRTSGGTWREGLAADAKPQDAAFIAAVSPDVVLALVVTLQRVYDAADALAEEASNPQADWEPGYVSGLRDALDDVLIALEG